MIEEFRLSHGDAFPTVSYHGTYFLVFDYARILIWNTTTELKEDIDPYQSADYILWLIIRKPVFENNEYLFETLSVFFMIFPPGFSFFPC